MSIYPLILFVHIISAIGLFFGNGTLLLSMAALRRAQRVEQARTILTQTAITRWLFPLCIVLLIVTGLGMAMIVWGVQGWIGVVLVSFVLVGVPLGSMVAGRRLGAIATLVLVAPDGPLSSMLETRIHDPVLGTALQTITALLLGIVFVMTTKPSLLNAILIIIGALVLGVASGMPRARRVRAHQRQELRS